MPGLPAYSWFNLQVVGFSGPAIQNLFKGPLIAPFPAFQGPYITKSIFGVFRSLQLITFGCFRGLKRPFWEFSGAFFQLKPFWLFPFPETNEFWLIKVKYLFIIFSVQNKSINLKQSVGCKAKIRF
jgi:hypothetical protein